MEAAEKQAQPASKAAGSDGDRRPSTGSAAGVPVVKIWQDEALQGRQRGQQQ